MLNGTLTLHDIQDIEAFCTTIANHPNRKQHNPHHQQDLIAYLIEQAWILSTRYTPPTPTFSTWAGTTLRLRTIDWIRTTHGDHRYPSNTRYTTTSWEHLTEQHTTMTNGQR